MRREPITTNYCYHVFSRSIAKFKIFNNDEDYLRFIDVLKLYQYQDFHYSYSRFSALSPEIQQAIIKKLELSSPVYIDIVAFCPMPTHFHLILKQIVDNGISIYMSRVLNSYSRYFNLLHRRKGPLWERRFRSVFIKNNEHLLHATRYLHINPTSAGIVKSPKVWAFSSYHEYISRTSKDRLCRFENLLDIKPAQYKKFVNDHVGYQKELSKIKYLLIDNYSG